MAKSGRIPQLDGIRGIAILLVIEFHAREIWDHPVRLLDIGWSGVDLFFVLSGFLITGILLNTRESPNYFRTFYARRTLRIFPLYYLYIAIVLLFAHHRDTNIWWFVAYIANWLPFNRVHEPFLHLWSLSIEEQFYLIWPLIVRICPLRTLRWVCVGVIVSCAILRIGLYALGTDPEMIYRITPTRLEPLAMGALVAIGLRMHKDNFMRWSVPVACMAGCGFMGVNANITQSYFLDPLTGTLGASLAALTFASLIVIATDAESGLARMLSFPPLVCVGRWSYAMYLAHFVVFKFSEGALKSWAAHQSATVSTLTKLGYFPFLALATTAIGALSWVLIERPLERIKSRLVYTFTAA